MRHAALALTALLGLAACGHSTAPAVSAPPAPPALPSDPVTPPAPPATPAFTPVPLTGFLVEPYLQHPTPSGMVVRFEPEATTTRATVEYRTLGASEIQSVAAAIEPVQQNSSALITTEAAPYTARLTGLASNTTHEYRVVTDAVTTPWLRFKTWPAAGDAVDTARFFDLFDYVVGRHGDPRPRRSLVALGPVEAWRTKPCF
jgi:hypothetical protein